MTTQNAKNVVRGFSLVLHDLKRSHYNRVWNLTNVIIAYLPGARICHFAFFIVPFDI